MAVAINLLTSADFQIAPLLLNTLSELWVGSRQAAQSKAHREMVEFWIAIHPFERIEIAATHKFLTLVYRAQRHPYWPQPAEDACIIGVERQRFGKILLGEDGVLGDARVAPICARTFRQFPQMRVRQQQGQLRIAWLFQIGRSQQPKDFWDLFVMRPRSGDRPLEAFSAYP